MKASFILYADAYDSIRTLEPELKGQLLDAIFMYQRGEELPALAPVVEMAFSFIRRSFERDSSKYSERCDKARESARMRWDKNNANACERILQHANDADTVPVPVPVPESDTILNTTSNSPGEPEEPKQTKSAKQPKEDRPSACPPEKWEAYLSYSRKFHQQRHETLGNRAPYTEKKAVDGARTLDTMCRVRGIDSQEIQAALCWAIEDSFWNEQVRALSSLLKISGNGDTKYANILTAMAKDLVRK